MVVYYIGERVACEAVKPARPLQSMLCAVSFGVRMAVSGDLLPWPFAHLVSYLIRLWRMPSIQRSFPSIMSLVHSASLPPSLQPQSVRSGTTTTTENNEFDSLSIANGLLRVAGRRARKSDRSTPTPQRCVQNRSRHDMKVDSSKTPGKAPFDVYMCAKTEFHDGGMQIFVRRQKRSSREDTTRALT